MAQIRRSCGSCFLLVAALVTAACGVRPTEPDDPDDYPCMAPDDDVGNRDLQDDPDYFWSVDDEYAALAREVPGGFGGMVEGEYRGRGEPGKTNFYLLDLSLSAEATTALGGTVATHHALQGRYDYLQLKSCYDALHRDPVHRIFDVQAVFGSDLDAGLNRIVLMVSHPFAELEVREVLRRIRIPQEMVVVEVGPPPVLHDEADHWTPRARSAILPRLRRRRRGAEARSTPRRRARRPVGPSTPVCSSRVRW